MDDSVSIVEVAKVDDELIAGIGSMVRQLSTSAQVPTPADLQEIIESPCTTLLVARDRAVPGRVVGMLTLVVFRIPTGVRAWIEDVAVDVTVRGRGVGEALSREALRGASARGARTVELSSRPSREAAIRPKTRSIFAFTMAENVAERRALLKAGFREQGPMPDPGYPVELPTAPCVLYVWSKAMDGRTAS